MLRRFPDGLQTQLGDGGTLISGGEGQRVRLGRAMLRPGTRLAILDEPFRGLDYEQRVELLRTAREQWEHATLICITHDIDATRSFARVLVVEAGRVVEDGCPEELASSATSRYRAMLESAQAMKPTLWSRAAWRHLVLERGSLIEFSREA